MRATDGQASLEWLAVTALVAVLVGVGAALAKADQVGVRVTRELARALCLVRHGDCTRDRDPCVVSASDRREGMPAPRPPANDRRVSAGFPHAR